MRRFLLPIMVIGIPASFLAALLWEDPWREPVVLIGKPAPAFDLPRLDDAAHRLSPQALHGQVWLLNVWASWCKHCDGEQPLLREFAHANIAPVYGLDYKDDAGAAARWLKGTGNPYVASVADASGRAARDYGVSDLPETFVIDRNGVIRYKLAGPLTPAVLEGSILPLVHELQGEMCVD